MKRSMTAIAVLLVSIAPSLAMTCDEFLGRTTEADTADLLPDFDVQPQQGMPEGFLEISNLRNIETGFRCRDGEFDGFGATLYEGAEPDRMRFAALVSSLMEAIAPDNPDGMALATRLQSKALDAAKKEEIRTGFFSGSAEAVVGDYDVMFGALRGMVQVQITPK